MIRTPRKTTLPKYMVILEISATSAKSTAYNKKKIHEPPNFFFEDPSKLM